MLLAGSYKLPAIKGMLVRTGLQPEFSAGRMEATRKHVRISAAPRLSYSESCIVGAAAARLAHETQHAFLAVREVRLQPRRKYVEKFMREPQKDVLRLSGTGACYSFEN